MYVMVKFMVWCMVCSMVWYVWYGMVDYGLYPCMGGSLYARMYVCCVCVCGSLCVCVCACVRLHRVMHPPHLLSPKRVGPRETIVGMWPRLRERPFLT